MSLPRISGRCANDGTVGAERAEEQHVLRRVREMVVAARDVRDGHVDVVDDDGEVIGRIAVGAEQDEVVDQLALELHVAADEVVKLDRARRHREADDVRRRRTTLGRRARHRPE